MLFWIFSFEMRLQGLFFVFSFDSLRGITALFNRDIAIGLEQAVDFEEAFGPVNERTIYLG